MSRASERTAETIRQLGGLAAQLLGAMKAEPGWHDQQWMMRWGGMRYSARVHELRSRGHRIDERNTGGRRWEYCLREPGQMRLL